ncbi:unnamed protein product [Eruca vesicaria subsp. sativa]|uniref:tRNase Z endonuclease domain-containing protein n=1 Tax=Eruca vesicaria subsp. sativa TaxID=29727 RepID=A0ABC8KY19_ERUVS|nr:unnamed protein product [Eruca vesicaria subsp. sativa]
MEKNKAKNGSKSSPFEFNKSKGDGFDKTGKNKKNLERKIRKLNTNNTAYTQVLRTGMDTQDTSSSVLLFFDNQRFIFNAGEGLQRFCHQNIRSNYQRVIIMCACFDLNVYRSDVLGSSVPGPIVLLVDCPTESHVAQLLSAESLLATEDDEEEE